MLVGYIHTHTNIIHIVHHSRLMNNCILTTTYNIVHSNVMYSITRGYEVMIEDIRGDDNERDTITVLKNSIYTMCSVAYILCSKSSIWSLRPI